MFRKASDFPSGNYTVVVPRPRRTAHRSRDTARPRAGPFTSPGAFRVGFSAPAQTARPGRQVGWRPRRKASWSASPDAPWGPSARRSSGSGVRSLRGSRPGPAAADPKPAARQAPMAGRSLGQAVAAVSLSVALASVAVRSSGCRGVPASR